MAVPIAVSGALNGSLFQDDILAKDRLISGTWPDKKTASTARNIQRPKIVVFEIAFVPVRYFSAKEEKQLPLGNFCKAQDKESGAGKRSPRYQSQQGDKYATPDFTRGRVDNGPLHADHRRLFVLCWAARASGVLITPAHT